MTYDLYGCDMNSVKNRVKLNKQTTKLYDNNWWTASIKPRLLFSPCRLCFLRTSCACCCRVWERVWGDGPGVHVWPPHPRPPVPRPGSRLQSWGTQWGKTLENIEMYCDDFRLCPTRRRALYALLGLWHPLAACAGCLHVARAAKELIVLFVGSFHHVQRGRAKQTTRELLQYKCLGFNV